jgi:hypothetical protein
MSVINARRRNILRAYSIFCFPRFARSRENPKKKTTKKKKKKKREREEGNILSPVSGVGHSRVDGVVVVVNGIERFRGLKITERVFHSREVGVASDAGVGDAR